MAYRRDRSIREAYDEHFHGDRAVPYTRMVNVADRRGDFGRPDEEYPRDFEYDGPRYYPNGGPRSYHGEDHRSYHTDNMHFGNMRRSGPPSRRDDGYHYYRGPREDPHGGRQMEFRTNSRTGPQPNVRNQGLYPTPRSLSAVVPDGADDTLMQAILNLDRGDDRDHFRRKESFPPQRDRSPIKRDIPPSSHSRSGSSLSSRSYSPEKSKSYSYQTQQKKRYEESYCQNREPDKERPSSHSVNTSRDGSPQSSTSISKMTIDKGSRSVDLHPTEALQEKADESINRSSDGPEARTQFEEAHVLEGEQEEMLPVKDEAAKMKERRSQAIAAKAREIEQVYRQDCETFGMVVKMLVAKEPSLERQLQNPLKENLSEIRERCLEDLRHFISEMDEVLLQPDTSS
ncbi:periphilin-1 isoform X1 [Megalops cyprinoides]|uniref:periphilin-1 isoform X1 n=1 Tax=Megalops cyprinoides TaxID=118141 RepID=UPI0018646CA6|nr:periphilin-1 isoform X1 [Megalops cyprinoides]